MSTLVESPFSVKDVDWNNQVQVGRGQARPLGHRAAIAVAKELFLLGRWDGRGCIVIHEPYAAHAKAASRPGALAAGVDYEFATEEAAERELDDDETLAIGRHYSWYAANEE